MRTTLKSIKELLDHYLDRPWPRPPTPESKTTQNKAFEPLLKKWQSFFEELPKPYMPINLNTINIVWNPRMRSRAGLCKPAERVIELNPHLLKEDKALEEVFIHEVCHMAISDRWPHAQAHGSKWKHLMIICGQKPQRCHELIPLKRHRHKRWDYYCACQKHEVTTLISNRINSGQRYKCKTCGSLLTQNFVAKLSL